ncbi:ribonuclease R [Limosilactobacillus fastidiosus]|uniref:Ribonuclease R n=1 Tax=Limosilactobacillus fastidiosus TaxID=2759855 RepID=A0A7W3YCD5_9LACO|nr:ribonuclease R [Limosilactobacillus fastidiosus]MBB1063259.1 ribonuclease R [Limosilactobacillus fastidiosus]MBB1086100.1 ribonuclease R [Limosilactobacillus fastidiosus]MCD7084490.1 ribonuclease R [Limosilactobacillus fastidiosus]MCD7085015.1 ribonuclease R [Limosilactobacillus fastidiosus]MCD7114527.1 ribonuclease R [Limosilactobacillus fastidiosus]
MTTKTKLKDQILDYLKDNANVSFSAEKLGRALKMDDAEAFTPIIQTLAELEREKQVEVTDQGEFKAIIKPQAIVGTFHANGKGFGFVDYDPDLPDMYINPDHTMHALNGDQVEVKILRPAKSGSDQGPEGQVVKIVEHNYDQIVGEFKQETVGKYVGEILLKDKKLSNYRFFVNDQGLKPMDGQVATATVATYPDDETPEIMTGAVNEVIGDKDEPGIDILSVIYAHDVPHEFPKEVMDEANKIPLKVLPEEKKGREDITNQPLVTIDAIESKDLDDAVVAWKMDNGHYHLGVHIADVSHYVKPGSALDKEAFKRGTSVYLTDRVVPMLPKRLSNGICSLNPGEERLSMSCEMEIDEQGRIVKHRIFPSVMRSHARMTYKAVNRILESHDAKTMAQYKELVPMFETMRDIHKILLNARKRRGAIDFEAPEAKIVVDDKGHPTDIQLRERGLAERMIESFMLAANETVAEHYYKEHVPFLYRIHEQPDNEKVKSFFEFLSVFGINAHGDVNNIKPKMLQNVLKQVAGKPEEQMVQVMMLRSMQQAKYDDEEVGHFGLGANYYTHFTSPIRRYPDDTVHRLIKWYEKHGKDEKAKAAWRDRLPEIAEHTSFTERRGIDTERDVDSMKKAEYMEDHVGETFDAVVSSVMKFGLFVELENTVEGLIHISVMNDDYYEYSEKHMALIGRSHHRIFQIGQPIKVKLVRVDKDLREVDFELVNPKEAPTTKIRVPHNDDRRRGGRGGRHNNHRHGHNKERFRNTQGKWKHNDHENGHLNNRQINRGQTRHHNNSRDFEGHHQRRH